MEPVLTPELASRFADLALAGVHREFPHKLDHVLSDEGSLRRPRELHPAFHGCFDWHSAVHGHWLLARLLRLMPGLPEAGAMRAALSTSLTPANIGAEVEYLAGPNTESFERTYGWAWLLKLAEELRRGARGSPADAEWRAWSEAITPLAQAFVRRYVRYLPRADYPIRTGVHANSAFGLAFAHDYAAFAGEAAMQSLVEQKAVAFFGADEAYPAHLEPSGADFLSPVLMEADLMRRVVGPDRFGAWLRGFLPGVEQGGRHCRAILSPAKVSDRADPQIVHLDGLNLSRAWCLRNLAAALPEQGAAETVLTEAADRHLGAALPHVASGHYVGEHWLATFAVLALTGDGAGG